MGKDRAGKFHPQKGKPSGSGQQKGVSTPPPEQALNEQFDLEEKYAIDADRDRAAGIHVMHPNRNAEKDQDRKPESQKRTTVKPRSETIAEDRTATTAEEIPVISKDTLSVLAAYRGRCVSIYLPTHRTGTEVNDHVDLILFKEMLQRAGADLASQNENEATILGPAYSLLRNDDFWKNPPRGFGFYIAEGFLKYIRIPWEPEQQMTVNTSFQLSPLMPYLTNQHYFYLLVMSKKQSKLFRADRFQMRYIPIPELPLGMDDVIHFEEKDDQKLSRTNSSGAGGANFHGVGGRPDEKDNISMYLAEVDNTLWSAVLNKEKVPLVLAGVDYLIPIYKKVSRYNRIWDDSLTGSLEYENEGALYRQVMGIMESYFREPTQLALANYGNRSATPLTTTDARDIVPAAYYSRVDQLFVQENAHVWGTFDEQTQAVSLHDRGQPNDEDLLDKAILRTYLNGGAVHLLNKEHMPAPEKMAALLRY